jgi:hypothetical protein
MWPVERAVDRGSRLEGEGERDGDASVLIG